MAALRRRGRMQRSRHLRSGRKMQAGAVRRRLFSGTARRIKSFPRNHHWGTKKICAPETQESQRFLGFFTPIFTVEIKRYVDVSEGI